MASLAINFLIDGERTVSLKSLILCKFPPLSQVKFTNFEQNYIK